MGKPRAELKETPRETEDGGYLVEVEDTDPEIKPSSKFQHFKKVFFSTLKSLRIKTQQFINGNAVKLNEKEKRLSKILAGNPNFIPDLNGSFFDVDRFPPIAQTPGASRRESTQTVYDEKKSVPAARARSKTPLISLFSGTAQRQSTVKISPLSPTRRKSL